MAQGAVTGGTAFNVQSRILVAAMAAAVVTGLLAGCGGGGSGNAEAPLATATAAQVAMPPTVPVADPPPAAAPAKAAGLSVAAAGVANTTLAGNQSVHNISATADGGFAVAWGSDSGMFYQRYDAQGAKAGGETRVDSAAAGNTAITVLHDGSVAVASADARGLVVRRVGAAETVVTASTTTSQPVLVALDDGGVAVGWAQAHDGGVLSQHAQRFDAQLHPSGAPVDFVAAGPDQNVSLRLVAAPGGNFVAGVTHRHQGIGYLQFRIGGRDVGPLFNADAGLPEFNTTLAPLADGRYALWSTGSGGGYLQLLDGSGNPLGAASPVAAVPETGVGLPDGGWVTVTRQMYGQPTLAQRFDAHGSVNGAPVEAAPGMSRPLLTARLGSGFAMAWNFNGAMGDSDVRTQRISAP